MLLIDTYLQEKNLKRYDVAKRSGVSQQVLSSAKNKKASELSMKVIDAIAMTVNKTPGAVLDELHELEDENRTFVAKDFERLVIALENQEDIIVIKEDFLEEVRPIVNAQLTSNEKEVFDIGFRGSMVWVDMIRKGYQKLTGKDTDEDKVNEYLRNYDVLTNAKDEIILRDRRIQY